MCWSDRNADDEIERSAELQADGIADDEGTTRAAGGSAHAGPFDHVGTEVDAGNVMAARGQLQTPAAYAATDIERRTGTRRERAAATEEVRDADTYSM